MSAGDTCTYVDSADGKQNVAILTSYTVHNIGSVDDGLCSCRTLSVSRRDIVIPHTVSTLPS
jgi:hypothetical protein